LLLDNGAFAADINQEILLLCKSMGASHDAIVDMLVAAGAGEATEWMSMRALVPQVDREPSCTSGGSGLQDFSRQSLSDIELVEFGDEEGVLPASQLYDRQ
jgi:hypothetical protein